MPRVTIAAVAAEAGVSNATVSKALNGTDCISPDTVRRVNEAVKKLGYKPNRAAQLLAGKNKNIGIIMPYNPEPVFSLFDNGFTDAIAEYEEYGFTLTKIKYNSTNEAEEFPAGIAKLKETVNGLIFIGSYQAEKFIHELRSLSIPKVSLQVSVEPSLCPSVTIDDYGVGRMAANFLSLCCRRVSMIVGDKNVNIHKHNIEGFRAEALKRSMEVTAVEESFDSFDSAHAITEKMLRQNPPDGIFVSSYVSPAVCACLEEHGMAEKIKVIGVDIWERTVKHLQNGSLTAAIYQNQPLQARRAVDMIVSMMRESVGVIPESVLIKPELEKESCLEHYL